MKRSIWGCSLIFVGLLAHADDALTPAEAKQVQETAAQLQATCASELQKVMDRENTNSPAAAMVNDLSPRYCTCLSETAVKRLTSGLLRTGRETDFQNLFAAIAQDCAADEFKESFPKICLSWFGQAPKLDVRKAAELERRVSSACACMQRDVNSLQGSQLADVTRATLLDYSEYQSDPKNFRATRQGSLFPSWQAYVEESR